MELRNKVYQVNLGLNIPFPKLGIPFVFLIRFSISIRTFLAIRLLFVLLRFISFFIPLLLLILSILSMINSHFYFLSFYSSLSFVQSLPIAIAYFITVFILSPNTLRMFFTTLITADKCDSNLSLLIISEHFSSIELAYSKVKASIF